jgi:transposase-like protein
MSDTPALVVAPLPDTTVSPDELLSTLIARMKPKQAAVFATLARGGSVTLAARNAGLDRSTIYKWLKPDHPFQQRLAQWKQDLADSGRTCMLLMLDEATQVIRNAIHHGDVRTALKVVERLGILAPQAGPSLDPLHAEKLRLDNQSRQRSVARELETERFLRGLDQQEPAPQPPSGAVHRSRPTQEPIIPHPPAA